MNTSLHTKNTSTFDISLKGGDEKTLSGRNYVVSIKTYFLTTTLSSESTYGLENTSSAQPRETVAPQAMSVLSRLEIYASAHMSETFIALVESIDWTRLHSQVILRALDLALKLNLNTLATELAQKGHSVFPDNVRLQKAIQVLCEPRIQGTSRAVSNRMLDVSRNWLSQHATQYRGKWVAVQAGKLLGVANSLRELQNIVGVVLHSENMLVTKVL